jgi:hypothetical protein
MVADSRGGSRPLNPSNDLLRLVKTYGITRDQAKRLAKKFRNDPNKIEESARILTTRSRRQPRFDSKHG